MLGMMLYLQFIILSLQLRVFNSSNELKTSEIVWWASAKRSMGPSGQEHR